MISPQCTHNCATIMVRESVMVKNCVEYVVNDEDRMELKGCKYVWEFKFRSIAARRVLSKKEKDGCNEDLVMMGVITFSNHGDNWKRELVGLPFGWTPRIFLVLLMEEGKKASKVFSLILSLPSNNVDICNVKQIYKNLNMKRIKLLVLESDFYYEVKGNI
mmetsp:Transcript_1058/g.1548  ORF Transcript_1058/g.1548 Transcript_1058/m.1548 type:complete len:161 (+) Transcript_1058:53-535(+)